jgi:hypothetical protein
LELVSRTPLTYNIKAELEPIGKIEEKRVGNNSNDHPLSEKSVAGFEEVLAIAMLLTVYKIGRKRR